MLGRKSFELQTDEVVNVDISSRQILNKMEELVSKAKRANSENQMQGYIMAIQALCEIMGNEKTGEVPHVQAAPLPRTEVSSMPKAEPMRMDEANGDSLFDF